MFFNVNLFKGMYVCVCVCVCVCICVCVCVDRSQEFLLLSLFRLSLSIYLWVTRSPGYSDRLLTQRFSFFQQAIRNFLLSSSLSLGSSSLFKSEICSRVLISLAPALIVGWGRNAPDKLVITVSFPRSLLL